MAGKLFAKMKITACAAVCLTALCLAGAAASADELSDYQQRQQELDSQAQEYQSILEQASSDIERQEEYLEALQNKLTTLNEQVANGKEQIAALNAQIEDYQQQLTDAQDAIADSMETLRQRLKAIYLSGETSSMEIILGATTFEDFLDKVELVSFISESDQKMIDELQSEIQSINTMKEDMTAAKEELDEEQKTLDSRITEMRELITENEKVLSELYETSSEAQDGLDETGEASQEIEDAILAYYADQAAQEEAARIASEAQAEDSSSQSEQSTSSESTSSESTSSENTSSQDENDTSSGSTSSTDSSSSASSTSSDDTSSTSSTTTTASSSSYVWPVPGHYTLTSVWNEDRGSYNHGAIDISDSTIMYAEVVAAQSGTVVLSSETCTHNYGKSSSCGCGGGYGNYLMIDHGDGKATLYAHLTSLTVSSGTYVEQGQVIGYVGSTGDSTGAHLHFETRLDGVKYNPMTEYPDM